MLIKLIKDKENGLWYTPSREFEVAKIGKLYCIGIRNKREQYISFGSEYTLKECIKVIEEYYNILNN